MPNELPDAAYKIFAGPGLITIGNKVTSHMSAISIKVSTLQTRQFLQFWGQYTYFLIDSFNEYTVPDSTRFPC